MRLICPNCAAQYEVSDDAIPPEGRDVQCSNCAHTWLEVPGGSELREAGYDMPPPARKAAPAPEPVAAEPVAAEAGDDWDAPEDDWSDDVQDPLPEAAETEPAAPAPARWEEEDEDEMPLAAAPRRQPSVTPEVSAILREEAAREEAARRRPPETFERQEELGLKAPDRPQVDPETQRAEESRRRMARMKGEMAPPTSAAVTGAAPTRKELLPDIEEINSSLHPSAEREAAKQAAPEVAEAEEAERRRGFRLGFGFVGLVAAALAFVYLKSPWIAEQVPAAGPALVRYVDAVDAGRLWLDLQLQGVIARIGEGDAASEG